MPFKILLIFALGTSLSLAAFAQDSSKFLKTKEQETYTLYFIKPITFKDGKNRLIPDFTFQHQSGPPEEVELKFSFFSKAPLREISLLEFYKESRQFGRPSAPKLMFLEKIKNRWHARFQATLPYSLFMDMLQAGDKLEIRVTNLDNNYSFPSNKKWSEAAEILREIIGAEVDE